MIELEAFQQHIDTLSSCEWEVLFELIPQIEATEEFGKLIGSKKLANGSVTFPYWAPAQIVDQTVSVIYRLDIAPVFDWTSWKDGKSIIDNKNLDYTTLDMITLCKLLTFIIRRDRFHDGYMISCFEDGTVSKIIKALKKHAQPLD